MSLGSPSSHPDFSSKPINGADYFRALEGSTGRVLPGSVILEGSFRCGGLTIERAMDRLEGKIHYSTINLSAADIGKIIRGWRAPDTLYRDVELGQGIFTEIIERAKRIGQPESDQSSFKKSEIAPLEIFADEQSFLVCVVSVGKEGTYRELGKPKVRDGSSGSFLRLVFAHEQPPPEDLYSAVADRHFMDRLTSIFLNLEEHGFDVAKKWIDHSEPREVIAAASLFEASNPFAEKLTFHQCADTLRDTMGIKMRGVTFPSYFPGWQDKLTSAWLRLPVSGDFISYHMTREAIIRSEGPLSALQGLRLSIQDAFDESGLSARVRVHLKSFGELGGRRSRGGDDTRLTLADFAREATSDLGRYFICLAIDFEGTAGSSALEASRSETLRRLFQELFPFRSYFERLKS